MLKVKNETLVEKGGKHNYDALVVASCGGGGSGGSSVGSVFVGNAVTVFLFLWRS